MITRENYEIYFIEFLEGKLSEEERNNVEIFLEANPDLREEFNLFKAPISIEKESNPKVDFSFLKKTTLIDKGNEDDFFIGFLEGDLNQEEVKSLESYLNEHPEKRKKLETFRRVILTPELVSFPDKSSLKKNSITITESNEDDFFIGHLEGDLSIQEEKELKAYLISNPEKEEKLESYRKTFVTPIIIPFPNKKSLKKSNKTPILAIFTPMAAAASVLFFIWINFQTPATIKSVAELELNYEIPFSAIEEEMNSDNKDVYVEQVNEIKRNNKTLASRTKSILNTNNRQPKKVKMDKIELNQEVEVKFENKLKPFSPYKQEEEVAYQKTPTTKTYTPVEFVKEKSQEIAKEKTGEEINTSNDLLAFATKKAKENLVPDFIEVETEEVENQKFRTIKIGRNFSIKRKVKS